MMRVFIADDEEIIRDGIRNCIETVSYTHLTLPTT